MAVTYLSTVTVPPSTVPIYATIKDDRSRYNNKRPEQTTPPQYYAPSYVMQPYMVPYGYGYMGYPQPLMYNPGYYAPPVYDFEDYTTEQIKLMPQYQRRSIVGTKILKKVEPMCGQYAPKVTGMLINATIPEEEIIELTENDEKLSIMVQEALKMLGVVEQADTQ